MHSYDVQLQKYLHEPSRDNFISLRDAVAASPDYKPYLDYRKRVYPLLDQHKYDRARKYLESVMPKKFLNPGIHELLSFVLRELAEDEGAHAELMLAGILLKGILSTGDGSRENPYLVLYIDDEYNVLEHFEKQRVAQSLVQDGDRFYDRLGCADGSQIWFDVTVPCDRIK